MIVNRVIKKYKNLYGFPQDIYRTADIRKSGPGSINREWETDYGFAFK